MCDWVYSLVSFTLCFAQFPLAQVHIRCNSNKRHGVGKVQKDSITEKLVDRPRMEKNRGQAAVQC